MWEKFFGYFKALFTLFERTERYSQQLDVLTTEVENMQRDLFSLRQEIKHVGKMGEERDKRILLEVENMLLKSERRLPPQP